MSLRAFPLSELAGLAALLLVACNQRDEGGADTATAADTVGAAATASRVATAEGFMTPEAVVYDAQADAYFVSNINGGPNDRDNNGFISRLRADGTLDSMRFVAGGRGGVTLHAPKGMALIGDTLWVTDIDAVRAFHRGTGASLASVDFRPQRAVFLNDLAAGPDNAIYVTDSGLRFEGGNMTHPGPDRVFRLAPDRSITVALRGDSLGGPNGITWDRTNERFLLGGFASNDILGWKPGETSPTKVATGPGGYDGLSVLDDGRILISSWNDSTVSVVTGQSVARLISGLDAPADFGVDTRRMQVAIPRFTANVVEIWSIPRR